MTAPWWMCNGWRSPWCVLDIVTRCKIRWVCDRHDWSVRRESSSEPFDPSWRTTSAASGSAVFTRVSP